MPFEAAVVADLPGARACIGSVLGLRLLLLLSGQVPVRERALGPQIDRRAAKNVAREILLGVIMREILEFNIGFFSPWALLPELRGGRRSPLSLLSLRRSRVVDKGVDKVVEPLILRLPLQRRCLGRAVHLLSVHLLIRRLASAWNRHRGGPGQSVDGLAQRVATLIHDSAPEGLPLW